MDWAEFQQVSQSILCSRFWLLWILEYFKNLNSWILWMCLDLAEFQQVPQKFLSTFAQASSTVDVVTLRRIFDTLDEVVWQTMRNYTFALHLYRYLVFDVSVFFPGWDRSSNLGAVQSDGKLDGKKGQQWRLLRLTHSNWCQLPFISRNTFDREDKTEIDKNILFDLLMFTILLKPWKQNFTILQAIQQIFQS